MTDGVSELMISTFSGTEKDVFGKDKDGRLPLLLPKAMEGHPIASKSILLNLPPEILGDITDLIADDKATLSALALVNSDCRQAAVRPDLEWVAHAHGDLYDSIWGGAANVPTPEHRNKLSKEAADNYIAEYRAPIQTAINWAMPHLETLLWHDRLCLDGPFFTAIANLPLRHLKLAGVRIWEGHRPEPPVTPLIVPLESLSLGIRLCDNAESHKDKIIADADADADAKAWENRSLTTLKRLTLSYNAYKGDQSLSFVWSSLLSAPLRHLFLPSTNSPAFKQALFACEPLRDLETLVVPYLNGKDVTTVQPMIDFISCHPHVHTLSIGDTSPQLMDSHLIPLLSDGRWSNLTSLSLVWSEPGTQPGTQPHTAIISADSLAAIGSIGSLEQICLSAGCQFGWRY
ncbi:hypothetical protein B0T26DRAFT_786602 [Lasiosphaeria miniovina]|uniref:F-box domain-containing protein n=1 Tax=Lasiosphaeria miniovina TaxID=1954250 RepID=A0AA40A623_9PEZI|nr:uncharacterized protein B0T26DRAFT_786602 [Lasiosphaeria miniovina]KAK0709828.1 hypothetical protein B0T26DRAFT_786602 [Lasiosphaeria miniovina]